MVISNGVRGKQWPHTVLLFLYYYFQFSSAAVQESATVLNTVVAITAAFFLKNVFNLIIHSFVLVLNN